MNKQTFDSSIELPVMESFYTIQGEGGNTGKAAYFIRLAGCDVGCVWCDVKESWDAALHPLKKISELVGEAVESGTRLVVITGGEPAMYDLTTLIDQLKEQGIETAIETSGTAELKGNIDWYCFSPKKFKKPVSEAFKRANELKIIIFNASDFAWAEELAAQVNDDCILFLQPEWSKMERFLPEIVEYVKNNPRWRISLQTHKFMQIP